MLAENLKKRCHSTTPRGGVSYTDLRGLWDSEIRKGKNLLPLAPRLKPFHLEMRKARKTSDARRQEDARADWERELEIFLARLSEEIRTLVSTGTHSWGMVRGREFNGKPTYQVTNSASVYFIERTIAAALSERRELRRPDRSLAVQQVARAVGDVLPKSVVRADIRSFFESIPHAQLLRAIEEANVLSLPLLETVKQFLDDFRSLAGVSRGVPRGTALGAALAEFYLEPLDRFMRMKPGLLLSVRYVDDVVIVVGEKHGSIGRQAAALEAGLSQLLQSIGLELNESKTQVTPVEDGSWAGKIEYLGYELTPGQHGTQIAISGERINRIRRRLARTFERWNSTSTIPDEGLLLDRIRLLTGNTRLQYNKQKAMVGIFFSNRDATSVRELKGLDQYLKHLTASASLSPRARAIIAELSFEQGFTRRRFHKFSTRRLREMKGAWNA